MAKKCPRCGKGSDPMERLFRDARARDAADRAADVAMRDPEISVVAAAAVWNDTYASLARHPAAGPSAR